MLAIRLKELEVELCRQQYQNQLLYVRAVELETQRDIRLKELELKLKTGQAWRSPSPMMQCPVQTPVNASSPLPAASPVLMLECTITSPIIVSVSAGSSDYSPSVDDLRIGSACLSDLSRNLAGFSSKLAHLSSSFQKELMQLIEKYSSLFSDVPTVTNVLEHDIDVGDHRPMLIALISCAKFKSLVFPTPFSS
ncbi:hypothetical protein QQF64_020096 [Cirrhinus molitorella]|uniref:Uncharacterized protein n=1 Tax=Cirrhinus molitorella TaxID=172907 RepID=A0ABR3LIU1_9TELE